MRCLLSFFISLIACSQMASAVSIGRDSREVAPAQSSTPANSGTSTTSSGIRSTIEVDSCKLLAEERPELAEYLNLGSKPSPQLSMRERARKCIGGVKDSWSDTVKELIVDPYNFLAKTSPAATKRYLDDCNLHIDCKVKLYYEAQGYSPSGRALTHLNSKLSFAEMDILYRNAQSRMNSTYEQNRRFMQSMENRKWVNNQPANMNVVLDPEQEGNSFWANLYSKVRDGHREWSCLTPERATELVCYYIAQVVDPTIAAGMIAKAPKLAKLVRGVAAVAKAGKIERRAAGAVASASTLKRTQYTRSYLKSLSPTDIDTLQKANFALNKEDRLTAIANHLGVQLTQEQKDALWKVHLKSCGVEPGTKCTAMQILDKETKDIRSLRKLFPNKSIDEISSMYHSGLLGGDDVSAAVVASLSKNRLAAIANQLGVSVEDVQAHGVELLAMASKECQASIECIEKTAAQLHAWFPNSITSDKEHLIQRGFFAAADDPPSMDVHGIMRDAQNAEATRLSSTSPYGVAPSVDAFSPAVVQSVEPQVIRAIKAGQIPTEPTEIINAGDYLLSGLGRRISTHGGASTEDLNNTSNLLRQINYLGTRNSRFGFADDDKILTYLSRQIQETKVSQLEQRKALTMIAIKDMRAKLALASDPEIGRRSLGLDTDAALDLARRLAAQIKDFQTRIGEIDTAIGNASR